MVNIELKLLTAMLFSGDFGPIQNGTIKLEHFETEQGKILFEFVTGYCEGTNREAKYPSLSIIRNRFEHIELPDPDPGDRVAALAHETVLTKARSDMRRIALELQTVSLESGDPYVQLPDVIGSLKKLSSVGSRTKHVSLASGFEAVLDQYDLGALLPNGIPWPWKTLQQATKGMQRQEFIVIAGRPKSRKTFVALNVAMNAFANHHARVLVFTPEMPRMQILLRSIAFLCALRYSEFKNAVLDELEMQRLMIAAERYAQFNRESAEDYSLRLKKDLNLPEGAIPTFDVIQSTGQSLVWMESQIEMFEPDIVVSDSFYRQSYDGKKNNDSDWKAVTAVSRGMKDMAMQTNVCLLATHQLNREAEGKVGGIGNMALADAVGQDGDLLLRVITKDQESAIVVLGGREVPIEGVMINNIPCSDYSEIKPILSKKEVEKWMQADDEEGAASEQEQKQRGAGWVAGQPAREAKEKGYKENKAAKAKGNRSAKPPLPLEEPADVGDER